MFKGSEIFATAIVCGPLIAGEVWSNSRTEDALGVAISPRMLILGKDQGGAVTVHTQIPYINVDTSSFTLDGIPSDSVWYDDCGNIVARFSESAVEAAVSPPSAVLTLEGLMLDGHPVCRLRHGESQGIAGP